MNQEIIDMAKEVGLLNETDEEYFVKVLRIEAFAALVAAAERDRILAVIGDNQCECRCAEVVRARGETK